MRDEAAEGEVELRYPIRGTFVACCASARWTETRVKPTNKTTMVFLAIRPCLLRFITGCPERFFVARCSRGMALLAVWLVGS